MGDGISTSFLNMGFNALSNSEYEYGENQYLENNDPNLSVGESLVLAATSNKLLSANNGTAITGDLTSFVNATGLLNTITSVAIGDNLTVVAGTNQAGVTTAPIIFSANGVKYFKSTLAANFPANVVHYNRFGKVFYVGNTTNDATADSAVTYVPPNGQGMALALGASDLFGTGAPGDSCRAIYSIAPGVSADPVTFLGGNLAANGRIGFSTTFNLATITPMTAATGPDTRAGRINAISCDDGLSDLTNYYVLAGGAFAGAAGTSNLIYTSSILRANPVAAQAFVNNEATAVQLFPAGAANSSVNAIAFNGSVFLVGGLGTVGALLNQPTVVVSTFVPGVPPAAGTFTFAIPTGCNIGSLVTNVNSLTWNGTYWIAGGTSTNGFVLLKSVDAVTWSYVSGAVTGATTALAVASKYRISTDVTNVQYTSGFGVVAQAGARTNPVTLNAPCGDITLLAEAGPQAVGNRVAFFTLNNSTISANDILVTNISTSIVNADPNNTNSAGYAVSAVCANGSAVIAVTVIRALVAAPDAPVIRFAVVHCN